MHKKLLPVAVIAAASIALAGCSAGPVSGKTTQTPAAHSSATPTSTPTPEAQPGTRENPFPVGSPGKYSESSAWTFTLAETAADAWPQIQAANEFNQPPAAGTNFVMSTLHIATSATIPATGGDPFASFQVGYVTASGNSFASSTCTDVLPGTAVNSLGTMYANAQADGTVCAQVPSADVPGGTWRVSSMSTPDAVFFAGVPKS